MHLRGARNNMFSIDLCVLHFFYVLFANEYLKIHFTDKKIKSYKISIEKQLIRQHYFHIVFFHRLLSSLNNIIFFVSFKYIDECSNLIASHVIDRMHHRCYSIIHTILSNLLGIRTHVRLPQCVNVDPIRAYECIGIHFDFHLYHKAITVAGGPTHRSP